MQTDINNNLVENPEKMVNEQEVFSNNLKRRLDHTAILDSSQSDCKQSMYETKKYHRLIEKRRRDRINECIYQLKDLLPGDLRKSTNKPMEKAVILELVVEYMQTLAEQRKKNENVATADFMLGYKGCQNRVSTFFESEKNVTRDNLIHHIDNALPACLLELKKTKDEVKSRRTDSGSDSSSSSFEQDMPSSDNSKQRQTFSSSQSSFSSSLSSSPVSDHSLPTENCDSSGSDNQQQKVHKRKVFHHHRSSSSSVQSRTDSQAPVLAAASSAMNPNLPVFINMPFVMNPGMIPATPYVNGERSNGASPSAPMPCLIKPSNVQMPTSVQLPGGLVMPQMTQDNASGMQVNGGVMPTFFVAAGPTMQQVEQSVTQSIEAEKKPQQGLSSEPVLIQPTMMMPFQNQGGFICMPSFTMAHQYTSPTLTS